MRGKIYRQYTINDPLQPKVKLIDKDGDEVMPYLVWHIDNVKQKIVKPYQKLRTTKLIGFDS